VFTDGTVQTADLYHLYFIKAQMQTGLHMTTDEVRTKDLQQNHLMNTIFLNHATSGK
jgi:hypothetical protein